MSKTLFVYMRVCVWIWTCACGIEQINAVSSIGQSMHKYRMRLLGIIHLISFRSISTTATYLFPSCACSAKSDAVSLWVQSPFLMVGWRWLNQRSRHCLQVRFGIWLDTSAHAKGILDFASKSLMMLSNRWSSYQPTTIQETGRNGMGR